MIPNVTWNISLTGKMSSNGANAAGIIIAIFVGVAVLVIALSFW